MPHLEKIDTLYCFFWHTFIVKGHNLSTADKMDLMNRVIRPCMSNKLSKKFFLG